MTPGRYTPPPGPSWLCSCADPEVRREMHFLLVGPPALRHQGRGNSQTVHICGPHSTQAEHCILPHRAPCSGFCWLSPAAFTYLNLGWVCPRAQMPGWGVSAHQHLGRLWSQTAGKGGCLCMRLGCGPSHLPPPTCASRLRLLRPLTLRPCQAQTLWAHHYT